MARRRAPWPTSRRTPFAPIKNVPRLEILEDRTLPALITVNTAQDVVDAHDGLTSLREAIQQANALPGADEIRFTLPAGSTLQLSQGQLDVSDSLTITGLGRDNLTLDAGGLSRHFEVASGKSLTLNDIKITGGSADRGGAIQGNLQSTIVLNRVELLSNVATLQGGAIAVRGGIHITDSRLANNSTTSTASNSSGGAIIADITNNFPHPTSTITNSVIENNLSGYAGGAITFAGGTLISTNTNYLNNRATNSIFSNGGYGGAINFGGGFTYGTSVIINGGTFRGNISNNGGAIRGNRAQLHISNADFHDNRAPDGPSASFAGIGGAIAHSASFMSVGSFSINTSTFRNNQSANGGGALHIGGPLGTIRNSTFSGNTAGSGGAIFTATGSISGITTTVTLDHVTVTNNTVTGQFGRGAGLYATDNTTVHNSILVGNHWSANVWPQGRGDIAGTVTASSSYNLVGTHTDTSTPLVNGVNGNLVGVTDPGLAALADNGGLTMTHELMPSSPAIEAGNPNSTLTTDQRGAIRQGVPDIGAFETQSPFIVTTTEDVVDPNDLRTSLREAVAAANAATGVQTITFAPPAGSVIQLTQGQLLVSDSVTITGLGRDNLTIDAGGLSRHFEVTAGKHLTLRDVTLTGGEVTGGGGAILVKDAGRVDLFDAALTNNQATTRGGAIHSHGHVSATNTRFAENTSGTDGGAIYVDYAFGFTRTLTLTDSEFLDNSASHLGGAMYLYAGSSTTLVRGQLRGNLAGQGGGAIASAGDGGNWSGANTLNISASRFDDNRASNGGAIVSSRTRLHITDVDFVNNRATNGSGGAVSSNGFAMTTGDFSVTRSTFRDNQATQIGGGLHLSHNTGPIRNSTFSGNTASRGGGIGGQFTISDGPVGLTLDHVTVTNNTAGTGGGVSDLSAVVTNALIAGNSGTTGRDIYGGLTSTSAYNIFGLQTGGTIPANGVNGNQVGVTDPRLAPLADNGGLTMTHALLSDSPAINAADPNSTGTDQRGVERPLGRADIGAFELFTPVDASFSVADAAIVEGDDGTKELRFTVALSAAVEVPASVRVDTADGTALAGSDYAAVSNLVLTFLPGGELARTVAVTIFGEDLVEDDEVFTLRLSEPLLDGSSDPGLTIATAAATGTIQNDDVATISIADAAVREGNDGATDLVFTLTLSNPVDRPVTVLADSRDLGFADPQPVPLQNATATFSQTSLGNFSIATTIDGNLTGDGWGISGPNGTLGQTAVWETQSDLGSGGQTLLTFQLVHNQQTQPRADHNLGRFRLSYTTDDRSLFADGLATSGDVTANWTVLDLISLTSSGGETFTRLDDLSVLVSGGANSFSTYTVTALTNAVGITGFRLEALEHPSLPTSGPGRSSNGNIHLSEFIVRASESSVPTGKQPATAGVDYTPINDVLITFTASTQTQTVVVSVSGDLAPEADEVFAVLLKNALLNGVVDARLTIARDTALGTILDDDTGVDPFTPMTGDFRIDSDEPTRFVRPVVAGSPAGATVVVWYVDRDNLGGHANRLLVARRYDAQGQPAGEVFTVAAVKSRDLDWHSVAMAGDGSFVVAWASSGADTSGASLFAQRYAADSTPLGDVILVDAYREGTPFRSPSPRVAMDAQGRFLIAWRAFSPENLASPVPLSHFVARRYQADGTPLGEAFLVSPVVDDSGRGFALGVGPNGHAAVVHPNPSDGGLTARLFDPAGSFVGEVPVNSEPAGRLLTPAVAVDDEGAFVVAWEREVPNETDGIISHDVYARRFAADGSPLGDEFRVHTYTDDSQYQPAVAIDADGDFVIAWASNRQLNQHQEVYLQRYSADGSPQGTETRVNDFTGNSQQRPALTMDAAGNLFVAWSDNRHTGNAWYNVYARRFAHVDGDLDTAGPTVVRVAHADTTLTVTFAEPLPASAGDRVHYTLRRNDAFDISARIASGSVEGASVILTLTQPLGLGVYTLTVGSGVVDFAGNSVVGEPEFSFKIEGFEADDPFTVNTTTDGNQGQPATASTHLERVIVWTGTGPGDDRGIFAQLYDNHGAKIGGEFRVNVTTTGPQDTPKVAMNNAGLYVVLWTSHLGAPTPGIYGRVYGYSGFPLTGEFRADAPGVGSRSGGAAGIREDGSFVVAYAWNRFDGNLEDIYLQRYDFNANPVGSPIRVNANTAGVQLAPSIAMLPGGGFVVAWHSDAGNFARTFDADGNPLTDDLAIGAAGGTAPSLATDRFGVTLVTWQSLAGIHTRRLDGSEQILGPGTAPSLSANPTGGFTVAWQHNGAIYAHRLDESGEPIGAVIFVSETGTAPSVSVDPTGSVVVAWQNATDVIARRYTTGQPFPQDPLTRPIAVSLDEDTSVPLPAATFIGAFADAVGPLTAVRITALPWQGTLALDGVAVAVGLTVPVADLVGLTYTPRPHFNGSDSFAWQGEGPSGWSMPAQVSLSIQPVPDAPLLFSDDLEVEEDGFLEWGYLAYDLDGGTLIHALAVPPSRGALTLSDGYSHVGYREFTYTPEADFFGTDTFTISATNITGQTTTHTVTVTVTPTPDAPVVTGPANIFLQPGESVSSRVSAFDGDGDLLTFELLQEPTHGTLTFDPTTGQFTYHTGAGSYDTDAFTARVSDGALYSEPFTVAVTIVDVSTFATMFNAGARELPTVFGLMFTSLDLPADADVPLLASNFTTLLGLNTLTDELAALLPELDESASPAEWLGQLQASSVQVLSFLQGDGDIPAAPTGWLAEFRLFRTFTLLADESLGDGWLVDSLTSLEGLPDGLAVTMDGQGTFVLTVDIHFGVDTQGFFLDASRVDLDADVSIALAGASTIAALGGAATIDLRAAIRTNPDLSGVLRPDGFATSENYGLFLHGDAGAALVADLPGLDLTWAVGWVVRTTDEAFVTSTVVDLDGVLELPGLKRVVDEERQPALLAVVGTYADGVWSLGTAVEPDARLQWFDFEVEEFAFGVALVGGEYAGTGTARLKADLGTSDIPVTINLATEFSRQSMQALGSITLLDQRIDDLLAFDRAVLTAAFNHYFDGSRQNTAGVRVVIDGLRLLPTANGSGAVTADRLTGTLGANGHLRASTSGVRVNVGTTVQVTGTGLTLDLTPTQTAEAVIATVDDATLRFSGLPDVSARVEDMTLTRGGRLEIDEARLRPSGPVTFAGLAKVTGLDLHATDLVYDAARGTLGGVVTITADRAEVLATGLTLRGLTGGLDLYESTYTLEAASAETRIAGLNAVLVNASLTWSPDQPAEAALVGVERATAELLALAVDGASPTVTFTGFGVRTDGKPFAQSVALDLPAGFAGSLGLGGLIPFDLTALVATFDDPDNLDTFGLTVKGTFALDRLATAGLFTPTLLLDGAPIVAGQEYEFRLRVESLASGEVNFVHLPQMTLQINGWDVAGTQFSGQIRLGPTDGNGTLRPLPGSIDEVDGFLVRTGGLLPEGTRFDLRGDVSTFLGFTTVKLTATTALEGSAAARFTLTWVGSRTGATFQTAKFEAGLVDVTFTDLTFDLSPVMILRVGTLGLVTNPQPGQPTAYAYDVSVAFLHAPNLVPGKIDTLALYPKADGGYFFHLDHAVLPLDGFFGLSVEDKLLDLEGATLTLTDFTNRNGLSGTVTLTAIEAALFPDESALLTAEISSVEQSKPGLTGSYDLASGVWTLTADTLTIDAGDAIGFIAQDLEIVLNPNDLTAPLATIGSAFAYSPSFNGLGQVSIEELVLYRDGFRASEASVVAGLGQPAVYGDLLEVRGATLTATNLSYRRGQGWAGEITLNAVSGRVLPNVTGFTATLTAAGDDEFGLTGTYDLSDGVGSLSLMASRLTLSLAGLFELESEGVTLDLDAETIATLTTTRIRLPGVAELDGLAIADVAFGRQAVTVGAMTVDLADAVSIADVLTVTGGTLTVEAFTFAYADPFKAGSVRATFTAASAALFDLGTVNGLRVEIVDGAITASATKATLALGSALLMSSTDLQFNLNRDARPTDPVLTLKSFTASSPDFVGLVPVATSQSLKITRQGFSLAALSLGGDDTNASFGDLLDMQGLRIRAEELAYDRAAGFSGVVRVRATSADLFDAVPGVTGRITGPDERPGLSGLYLVNEQGWRLSVTAAHLALTVGDLLIIRAEDVTLRPHSNNLATIDFAQLELPGIVSFDRATMTDFILRRDGLSIGSASVALAGTHTIAGVIEVTRPRLDVLGVDINWDDLSRLTQGSIVVGFDRARLFPNSDGTALGTVTGLSAYIDTTGVWFATGKVTLRLGNDIEITAEDGIDIDLDATGDHPLFRLPTATVRSASLGTLFDGVTFSDVKVFRDGFTIGGVASAIGTAQLAGVLAVDAPTFTGTGLGYRLGTGFTGTLSFAAATATLFPDLALTASVAGGVTGALSLADGTVTVSGGSVALTLGGFLNASSTGTPAFTFTFDPKAKASDTLLSLSRLTASLDALSAGGLTPTAEVSGLAVTYGGRFHFTGPGTVEEPDIRVTLPAGYANSVGIGEFLPLNITSVDLAFDPRSDLRRVEGVRLDVRGSFALQQLTDALSFTPTLTIGGVNILAGDPFSVSLEIASFRQGKIKPVNVGPITLGVTGLKVPGTQTTANGLLQIGAIDATGRIGLVDQALHQLVGTLTVTSSDWPGLALGTQLQLKGSFSGSKLTAQGNVIASAGSGDAAVGFELTIDARRQATAPFVNLDIDAKLTDLVIQNVEFNLAALKITVGRVEVLTTPAPDGSVARLVDATLSFPQFPEWGTFSIASLAAFDDDGQPGYDGFALDGVSLDLPSRIKTGGFDVLDLQRFTLSLNKVVYRNGAFTAGSAITLAGTSGTLFPDRGLGGFSSRVQGVHGSLNLSTGGASLTADEVELTLDGKASLTGRDITFTFAPGHVGPIATLGLVEVRVPGLTDILGNAAGEVADIKVYGDRIEVGAISVTAGPITVPGLFRAEQMTVGVSAVTLHTGGSALGGATVSITEATLLPGQDVATLTGLTASFTDGVLEWTAASVTADVEGAFTVTGTGVTFRFDTKPGAAERLYFGVDEATATLDAIEGIGFTVGGFGFRLDGEGRPGFFVDAVEATAAGGIGSSFGLGDFLPLDVTLVRLDFADSAPGQPTDFRTFTLWVEGTVDVERFGLPFDLTVRVGNQVNAFAFAVAVDLASGRLMPVDFGPIALEVSNLELGPVTLGGSIEVGGIQAGELVPTVSGSLSLSGGVSDVQGNATVSVTGTLDRAARRLDLSAAFNVGFKLGDLITVTDATLGFDMALEADGLNLSVESVVLTGAGIDSFEIALPGVTVAGTNVRVNFSNDETEPLVIFQGEGGEDGSASLRFAEPLSGPDGEGWGGTLYNFAIGRDLKFYLLPNFGASITIPDASASTFGLPEWLPLSVREIGFQFNGEPNPTGITQGLLAGSARIEDFTNFSIIFSGGLNGQASEVFPITAQAERMRLNVEKLVTLKNKIAAGGTIDLGTDNPIENLEGITLGLESFELGPIRVGGRIGFGIMRIDTDGDGVEDSGALFGSILGEFGYEGVGGGLELIVTQYGPVLSRIFAGVPITLAYGFMISGFEGAFIFGGDRLPTVTDPVKDFLYNEQFVAPTVISPEEIRHAMEYAAQRNQLTWDSGFTMTAGGKLTHMVAMGLINGEVTLGANFGFEDIGFQLFGVGDVNIVGASLGSVGLLLDASDPINPALSFGLAMPGAGSHPLMMLLPARGEFGGRLATDGVAEALAYGLGTFVRKLTDASAWAARGFFNDVMTGLAARLNADRGRPLARFVLDSNGDGVLSASEAGRAITAELLRQRLTALLPTNVATLQSDLRNVSRVAEALLSEVMAEAGRLAKSGITFDVSQSSAGLLETMAGGATAVNQAIAALVEVIRDAALSTASGVADILNPSLTIRGAIQPVILGIPFGSPLSEVELLVNKSGLGFQFNTSINQLLNVFGGIGVVADWLRTGGNVGFGVSFPIGDNLARILKGEVFPEFGEISFSDFVKALEQDVAITVSGGLSILGFETAALDGLGFGRSTPTAPNLTLENAIQKVWLNPTADVDPTKIPIATEAQYLDLLEYGGLLLSGQLFAPEALTNPAALLQRLVSQDLLTPPDDYFQYLSWAQSLAAEVTKVVRPASVQLFLPSAQALLDAVGADFEAPQTPEQRFSFASLQGDSRLAEYLSAFYFGGVWDSSILSVPLGNARVEANADRIEIEADLPWLAGTRVTFQSIRPEDPTTLDALFAEGFGIDLPGLLPAGLPASIREQVLNLEVPSIPKTSAAANLDTDAVADLINGLGLGDLITFDNESAFQASLRAYSPGFDPESTDLLKKSGGFEITAEMGIKNLIDEATFTLGFIGSGTSPGVSSHFTATASVDGLKVPGLDGTSDIIQIDEMNIALTRDASGLYVGVEGALRLFARGPDDGLKFTIEQGRLAVLPTGVIGTLVLKAAMNPGSIDPSFGITVDGRFEIRIDTTKPTPEVGLWLTGKDGGVATVSLMDHLKLTGQFTFESGATGLLLTAKGAQVQLRPSQAGASAFLEFDATGALQIGSSGVVGVMSLTQKGAMQGQLPLQVSGTFQLQVNTTTQDITALGGMQVNLPRLSAAVALAGQIHLSQSGTGSLFTLTGGFRFTASLTEVALAVDASLSIGLVSLDQELTRAGEGMNATGTLRLLFGSTAATRGIVGVAQVRIGNADTGTIDMRQTMGFVFGGAFTVEVNTTGEARDGLAAGLLRLAVTAGTLKFYQRASSNSSGSEGFTLSNGRFLLEKTPTQFTLAVEGDVGLLDVNYRATGSLILYEGVRRGMEATASLQRLPGQPTLAVHLTANSVITLNVNTRDAEWKASVTATGGLELGDDKLQILTRQPSDRFLITMTGTPAQPKFSLEVSGEVTLGSVAIPLRVSGKFDHTGAFTLAVSNNTFPIKENHSTLALTGSFTLQRNAAGVVTFKGNNVKLRWGLLPSNANTLNVLSFEMTSRGKISVEVLGGTFPLTPITQATPDPVKLVLGTSWLDVDPATNTYLFRMHLNNSSSAELHVPGLGQPRFKLPAINVGISGWPTIRFDKELDFTFLKITGSSIQLNRSNSGVYTVSILPRIGTAVSPTVAFPLSEMSRMGTFSLSSASISANGNFSFGISRSTQLGNSSTMPVSLSGGSFTVSKTGNVFKLTLQASNLVIPLISPIPLNNFSFTFEYDPVQQVVSTHGGLLDQLQASQFPFGNAFKPDTSTMPSFNLGYERGAFVLRQAANTEIPLITLPGSSGMVLRNLVVGYDFANGGPLFSGSISGRLKIGANQLAKASFTLAYDSGKKSLLIATTEPAQYDFGFVKLKATGYFRSNGEFEFRSEMSALGFASLKLTVSKTGVRIRGPFGTGDLTSDGWVIVGGLPPFRLIGPFLDILRSTKDVLNDLLGSIPSGLRLQDGPLAGATVFLDVNGNGIRDWIDLDGDGRFTDADELEPSTQTDAEGRAVLLLPPVLDKNGNGRIDPDEGVLVGIGGYDTATMLPQTTPLWALPSGSPGMITPLTTLHAELVLRHGLEVTQAWERLRGSLSLPDIDLAAFDPLDQIQVGDPAAPAVYRASAQVQNILTQVSALLLASGHQGEGSAARAVAGELAARIIAGDFLAESVHSLRALLQNWADRGELTLDAAGLDATAEILARLNGAIALVPVQSTLDYVNQITRWQMIALGAVTDDLQQLSRGERTATQLLQSYSPTSLIALIAQTTPGNLVAPLLTLVSAQERMARTGTQVGLTVHLSQPSALPIQGDLLVQMPNGLITVLAGGIRLDVGVQSAQVLIPLPAHLTGKGGIIQFWIDKVRFASTGSGGELRLNTAPVAQAVVRAIAQGRAIALNLLSSSRDLDRQRLITRLVALPRSGMVRWTSPGVLRYTPRPRFAGIDRFSYRVFDGLNWSRIATITIRIQPAHTRLVPHTNHPMQTLLHLLDRLHRRLPAGLAGVTARIQLLDPSQGSFTSASLRAGALQQISTGVYRFAGNLQNLPASLRKLQLQPPRRWARGSARVPVWLSVELMQGGVTLANLHLPMV